MAPARPAPTSAASELAVAPHRLVSLQRQAGNRAIASRIPPPSASAPANNLAIRRKMTKGEGWVAATGSSVMNVVSIGFAGWKQPQIDQEWQKIAGPHGTLKTSIETAEKAAEKVTDTSSAKDGLDTARKAYSDWDRAVNWPERTAAGAQIQGGIEALGGASTRIKEGHEAEVLALEKALGKPIADKLLGERGYTPKDLSEILANLSPHAMKKIAEDLTLKEFTTVVESENIEWANLKKLSALGGPKVLSICRTGVDLEALFVDSTVKQVESVVDGLSKEAIGVLGSLGAKYIVTSLLTPLEKAVVERLTEQLTVGEIKELVTAVPAAVIKGIVPDKVEWAKQLHEQRDYAARVLKHLAADSFVEHWNYITPRLLKKLWEGKPEKSVASLLTTVGKEAVKDLIGTITQEEMWHASARLGNAALKGLGGAMTGANLKILTGGLGKDPAPAPAVGAAAPTDAILKELGKDHAATLKSARTWLGFETFNEVIRRCQAGGLDAAGIADFLTKAVTYKWKTKAKLIAFFDKAGANVAACVAIADDFEAAGNDGRRPDIDGGKAPATAVHSRVIATRTYKVAEGDVKHYLSGHSYPDYAMTDANAGRGDSSMWGTGDTKTTIEADADTVLQSGGFAGLAAAAGAGYLEHNIGNFRAGLDGATGRMTKLFPRGNLLAQARMEAVAKLFQSKE